METVGTKNCPFLFQFISDDDDEGARSQQFPLSVSPICLQLHRDRVGGSRLLDTEPPRRDTGRSSDSSVS